MQVSQIGQIFHSRVFITESVNCDKILTRDHYAILLFMFYDFSINKSQVDSCQC